MVQSNNKAPREVASLVLSNNRFINFVKFIKLTYKILKSTNENFRKRYETVHSCFVNTYTCLFFYCYVTRHSIGWELGHKLVYGLQQWRHWAKNSLWPSYDVITSLWRHNWRPGDVIDETNKKINNLFTGLLAVNSLWTIMDLQTVNCLWATPSGNKLASGP